MCIQIVACALSLSRTLTFKSFDPKSTLGNKAGNTFGSRLCDNMFITGTLEYIGESANSGPNIEHSSKSLPNTYPSDVRAFALKFGIIITCGGKVGKI